MCLSAAPVIATPNGAPKERVACFQNLILSLSVSPVKVLLTKKSLPSLEIPGKGASLLCSPKLGSYGKRCQFPEPYLTYLSGSPVNKPSLQVLLTERDAPFPELSFICLSKSLVNEPSLQVPQQGPLWRDSHFQGLPLHIFQGCH
jgi:hypothetical protein